MTEFASFSLLPRSSPRQHNGSKNIIEIPIKGEDEVIEVSLNELPGPEETLTILRDEEPPLDIWYRFALEYYRRDMKRGFEHLLQEMMQRVLPALQTKSGNRRDREFRELQRLAVCALNSQACYYLFESQKESDIGKRNLLLGKVISLLNEADKVDPHEKNLWVVKGYNYLVRQEYDAAVSHFNAVLQRETDHPLATLGAALVAFRKKDYDLALTMFSRCLRSLPIVPPFVRYAIGVCHMQLKSSNQARLALERALHLHPNDVNSLLALAIVTLNERGPDSVIKSMNLFKKVYELEPTNSISLNHLAHHFLIRGDYEKARLLASNAMRSTDQPQIRAESAYHLGTLSHIQGQFEDAMQHYLMATQWNSQLVLAWFGLAQMNLWKGNLTESIRILEKVLQDIPDNYECVRMLGSLYLKSHPKTDRAIKYLRRAVQSNPRDAHIYLELATSYEGVDDIEASKMYDQAILLLGGTESSISPQIWNNLGAVKQRVNDYEAAKNAYETALRLLAQTEDPKDPIDSKLTHMVVRYNLARLHEELSNYPEAERLYKEILQENPKYVDAYLRLGHMCQRRGQLSQAYDWFKEALIDGESDRPDLWCLMGEIHMMKNEYKAAIRKFERYVKLNNRNQTDPYSLLSLANAYWQHSRHSQDKDTKEKARKKAAELYVYALKNDPHNIYAAHGLGILLAEKTHYKEALDVFLMLREVASDFADLSISIGHVQFELGQKLNAIKTYEACSKKSFGNRNVPLLMYIARAYYSLGKVEKNAPMLEKALSCLEHTVRIRPQDGAIWFNLALCEQDLAVIVLHKDSSERSIQDVDAARDRVATALK
jgi:RNA polymerase-associated protein CTR9